MGNATSSQWIGEESGNAKISARTLTPVNGYEPRPAADPRRNTRTAWPTFPHHGFQHPVQARGGALDVEILYWPARA
jgi:hypothetical protein